MTRKEKKLRAACIEVLDRRLAEHIRKSSKITVGMVDIKELLLDPGTPLELLRKAMAEVGMYRRRINGPLPPNVVRLVPRSSGEPDDRPPAA